MGRLKPVFQGALCLGAVLAVVGGGTLAVLQFLGSTATFLPRLEAGYRHIVFGFLFLSLFAVAAALLEALSRARPAEAPPDPTPELQAQTAPAAAPPVEPPKPAGVSLAALYHEMKTYVDLEMWELALEKAQAVVKGFPGTREAELVGKNLNELRWKAEPKFVSQASPMTADQEKLFKQKGLAQMYQHVKTYMDLEMWELARQKAVAVMKNFPDSPESNELIKIFEIIEKKAREATGAAPKA
jgi:hypothetical protein